MDIQRISHQGRLPLKFESANLLRGDIQFAIFLSPFDQNGCKLTPVATACGRSANEAVYERRKTRVGLLCPAGCAAPGAGTEKGSGGG